MSSAPDGRSFLADPDTDPNMIAVHSMVKTWYLTTLQGYSVVRQTASPVPGWFGSIGYKRTWILTRAD